MKTHKWNAVTIGIALLVSACLGISGIGHWFDIFLDVTNVNSTEIETKIETPLTIDKEFDPCSTYIETIDREITRCSRTWAQDFTVACYYLVDSGAEACIQNHQDKWKEDGWCIAQSVFGEDGETGLHPVKHELEVLIQSCPVVYEERVLRIRKKRK